MASDNLLVEVRVTTYRRPDDLRRALSSLQAQTFPNWICRVYDDSPDTESENLCAGLHDDRIVYSRNNPRRFAAENIDRAFEAPQFGGDYAFLLEDDNWLLPGFIEENIADIGRHGTNILLRNQCIAHDSGVTQIGILDSRFCEGVFEPLELLAATFSSLVVSNGGLFWSREAKSKLRVGFAACGAVVQEHLRGLAIAEKVAVMRKPLAVWRDNGAQTTRNPKAGKKQYRAELRAAQLVGQAVYDVLKRRRRLDLLRSERLASPLAARERGVIESLRPWRGGGVLSLKARLRALARGTAISMQSYEKSLLQFLAEFESRYPAID